MRKSLVVIFLLSMLSTQAQELNFWQKANNMLTKFKNIDSTYVYQPKQGFTLGLFSSIQRVGIDVTAMFDINYDDLTLPGSSKYSLREGVSPKIGLELGYGKLVLGYGVEVGPKRAYKKQAFGLNLLGKSWGLHFNYFNLSNRFKTNIEIGEEGQDDYHTEEILSKTPPKWNVSMLMVTTPLTTSGSPTLRRIRPVWCSDERPALGWSRLAIYKASCIIHQMQL